MSRYSRILIIQTAFLGDVILITPLIRSACEAFPGAEVDVLAIPQTITALGNNPYITRLIPFGKRENKAAAFCRTRKTIVSNRYDLALIPHGSGTTTLLAYSAKIKRRVGFARGPGKYFHTDTIPFPESGHRIEKNLNLLRHVAPGTYSMQTELFPGKEDYGKADRLLEGLTGNKPVIAIAPGSVWATKRWRKEHYITLTKRLYEEGYSLVFIGAEEERRLSGEIIRRAGVPVVNCTGQTNILESAAVIDRSDLLICNDSGAMHIANAMKTDVFAFFGPTVKQFGYYPYRENDRVFEIDLACRPCAKHGGAQCPLKHHDCMWKIDPSYVAGSVRMYFSKRVS